MAVWPKFVYTFDVSRRTAATARKLRDAHGAPAQQDQAFRSLMRRLAGTSFWKPCGIEAGMRYADFQSRVPLHPYARIAPAVEQMRRGEANLLWPGACTLFGLTSGTSSGQPKCLPITDGLLAHFRHAGLDALLYYTARAGHTGAFQGRHLFHGAPTIVTPVAEERSDNAYSGAVSAIAALNFPAWVEKHLYEPGPAIARVSDASQQVDAIASRTASRDITLLAGVPNNVTLLASALRARFFGGKSSESPLQTQWPNLECFVHGGASVAPHFAELRRGLGDNVEFHEVYAASEGFIAVQDMEAGRGLRMMADMGLFFEFVPLAEFDDLRLDQLGTKAVPLAGVKTGINYVILLTTPAGLARYILGDVVRFASLAPPRILYVGGTELRLNAFAENLTERDLTDGLVKLCDRHNWTLVNFHVAPHFTASHMTGQKRGGHEWWIELKPGTTATPTGPHMAGELDVALRETSALYASKRASGLIDFPIVRLVMPGVFEHWLRFHQKWGGQHKMPRCRSDRRIADEFATITNFARD